MLPVGLVIVMGTGTSFGTVPVLAVLYVPLCSERGFGLGATTLLVAAAATIGDTSFHVSDITLAPTSGLNVDGQHDYIWDTCVIPLIALDIPMFILACAHCSSKVVRNRSLFSFKICVYYACNDTRRKRGLTYA